MVHFTVEHDDDGSRTLYLEGTRRLVGWIESGRRMIDGRGRWTEWGFRPAAGADRVIVRRNISDAYQDARDYAATLRPEGSWSTTGDSS